MVFSTKFGGLMKQIVSRNGQVPATSMLNRVDRVGVRYMSSQLFIGGLSFHTNEQALKAAFSSFGDVTYVRVITDRDTGRSRGYGFVTFASEGDASAALSAMDGQELNGRNIRVSVANERPTPTRTRSFNASSGGVGGRDVGLDGDDSRY